MIGNARFEVIPTRTGDASTWMPCVDNNGMGQVRLDFSRSYEDVYEQLLHELLELTLHLLGLALVPCHLTHPGTAGFRYFLNHEEFQNAVAQVSDIFRQAEPDVRKAWKKARGGGR